ncbi:glycosyltransferase family 39 protein [Hymenobacter sp. 5317J-9]|uniref:ArnT family glycosyltransferase n=1 Tax=Hymenobacter sp. 5317J-9 TaxID=2932250 RepID=UPI001FD7069C|nr:glycosyltransferase family 39 protein [Hymenobacter sp. 5317J-9]UOQ98470.1 glycosyltransferase family 39 protein [Hymenobacter sp. 5317J-9]
MAAISPASRPAGWPYLLLAVAAGSFLLFWKLGSMPAQQWDEARAGIHALEALRHPGEWLVSYYKGAPDLWVVKPPLLRWLQSLCFATLGPTELALRLPSALAGLGTLALVWAAGRRWLGHPAAGLLAALVLATAGGFVTRHVTRGGDYDALLTICTTGAVLSWLGYVASGRARLAWVTGIALALAVLTKGVAGVLIGPGLLALVGATGSWHRLRRPAPWLAAALVLAVAAIWYGLRERAAPGYLAAVWQNEGPGRFGAVIENNEEPFHWYISKMVEAKFSFWLAAALLGYVLGWARPRGSRGWWLTRATAAAAGGHLLIISLARTKLAWYDAPLYPLLALQAAAGLWWAGQAVVRERAWRLRPAVLTGAVLLAVAGPYAARLAQLREWYQRRFELPQLLYGNHLRAQVDQHPELNAYALATDGTFNDSPEYYRQVYATQHQHRIARTEPDAAGTLAPGTVLVACGAAAARPWLQRYQCEVLVRTDSCFTLRLGALR